MVYNKIITNYPLACHNPQVYRTIMIEQQLLYQEDHDGDTPIACAGLRQYSETDIEVKRVWVMPDYRRHHLGTELMNRLHERAAELGYERTILLTRELMVPAVKLYERMGYTRIPNYPPYDHLDNAICMVRPL